MENILNPYRLTWAELIPENGVVTVRDQKAFGELFVRKGIKTYRKPFANKELAKAWVRGFNKHLDKAYTVLYSTDRQFGLATPENNYAIPYTKKQMAEKDYINN